MPAAEDDKTLCLALLQALSRPGPGSLLRLADGTLQAGETTPPLLEAEGAAAQARIDYLGRRLGLEGATPSRLGSIWRALLADGRGRSSGELLAAARITADPRQDDAVVQRWRAALEPVVRQVTAAAGAVEVLEPGAAPEEAAKREEILDRVESNLILAGPNLRGWLSDPLMRRGLVTLIKERSEVTVTFVLGTLGMLRELHGDGEAHLKASVIELDEMRSQLTLDQRRRMRCFFHWGAATLSAVFIDPDSPSGVLFFTPRWGYDHHPRQRLTCMIEKRNNSDLFGILYDPLLLLTQPTVTQLDEMLELIRG